MSGLWLENGLHLNIADELAAELARELSEKGFTKFGGSKVIAVLPTSPRLVLKEDNFRELRPHDSTIDPVKKV